MKNKIIAVTLTLACLLFSGCSKQKLIDETEVNKYLKKAYPNEKFEIISVEQITLSDVGGCDDGGKGNSWKIKSINNDIEFKVEDAYNFNSFTCEYSINDNYFEMASNKFLEENNDPKIKTYHACYNCLGLSFVKEDFTTKDEMINFIKQTIYKLKNTYPFKYPDYSNNIYISISNSKGISKQLTLEEINDETKLKQIIEQI